MGVNLQKAITYRDASFRYFDENEYHITRFCKYDVLLLVFEGVLRFSENGRNYEVFPGQYHIQKHDMFQTAEIASSSPKYLYVHFLADWSDDSQTLPYKGSFDYFILRPFMESLDYMSHNNYTITEQMAEFFKILSLLYRPKTTASIANKIADFISENYKNGVSLEQLSQEFNYSKNHIINLFKKEYKMTPFAYINYLRTKQAEWLLDVTSQTAASIACECGFHDYSHFYKEFLKANKVSPSEWREARRREKFY